VVEYTVRTLVTNMIKNNSIFLNGTDLLLRCL